IFVEKLSMSLMLRVISSPQMARAARTSCMVTSGKVAWENATFTRFGSAPERGPVRLPARHQQMKKALARLTECLPDQIVQLALIDLGVVSCFLVLAADEQFGELGLDDFLGVHQFFLVGLFVELPIL